MVLRIFKYAKLKWRYTYLHFYLAFLFFSFFLFTALNFTMDMLMFPIHKYILNEIITKDSLKQDIEIWSHIG